MEPLQQKSWNWILQESPVSLGGFEETAVHGPLLHEPVFPASEVRWVIFWLVPRMTSVSIIMSSNCLPAFYPPPSIWLQFLPHKRMYCFPLWRMYELFCGFMIKFLYVTASATLQRGENTSFFCNRIEHLFPIYNLYIMVIFIRSYSQCAD